MIEPGAFKKLVNDRMALRSIRHLAAIAADAVTVTWVERGYITSVFLSEASER